MPLSFYCLNCKEPLFVSHQNTNCYYECNACGKSAQIPSSAKAIEGKKSLRYSKSFKRY